MSASAMAMDKEPDAPIAEEEEVGEEIEVGHLDAGGEPDDSDPDAEGELDEEDGDDEDGEFVGAVKTRSARPRRRKASEEESDAGIEVDDEDDDDSEADTSPGAEEDWEAADDVEEDDLKVGHSDANRCVFCKQTEEEDPGEEYEDYLACRVCGDNAHRQCARDADTLAADEDAEDWRCQDCVANGLEEDFKDVPHMLENRRRSSAPKMARDLLPAARGGIKPGSHSVFNTLILPEDAQDGSRSLRKRKTPSAEDDEPPRPAIRKRMRTTPENEDEEAPTNVEEPSETNGEAENEQPNSPQARPSRPHRQTKAHSLGARIISRSEDPKSAIIAIPVSIAQWDQIEKDVQKKQKRRERDRQRRLRNNQSRRTLTAEPEEPTHFPAVQTDMYNNPFFPFQDKEVDENRGRPYGGILTDAEADTARTYPTDADREAFQNAREKAEQEWREKLAKQSGETPARSKQSNAASKIKCINFGQYEIDTWHAAPYPEEYSRNKHLYICEFCLKYMSSDYVAWRHKLKCSAKHPPGDEIYRQNIKNPETGAETTLSFFEVDGRRNPLYCQNLCLLAKLFLGSKTLYYDVEPFLFYIMTENDEFGCHFVGYFSKEKRGCGPPPAIDARTSFEDNQDSQANSNTDADLTDTAADPALSNPGNNVSCILVLPVHMRRGFGKVLIEFSYMLTKVEGRTGSPEKPLSDMGLVSYRSYWREVICKLLLSYEGKESSTNDSRPLSIVRIAKTTGMTPDDIVSTLEALRFLVRDPITKTYALRLDYDYMKEYIEKHEKKATIKLDPANLVWTPYIMGRPTNLFAMGEETNQPLQTVAAREEPVEVPDQRQEGLQRTLKALVISQSQQESKSDVNVTMTEADAATTEATEDQPPPHVNGTSPKLRKKTPPPLTLIPQPSKSERPPTNGSPSRRSPRKTPNGGTQTLDSGEASPASFYSGSQPGSAGSIPPTRYEIFPPVPGAPPAAKRRPGRPFGTRRSGTRNSYGSTPRRSRPNNSRRHNSNQSPSHGPSSASALRRTRSTLGEVAMAAADNDEDDPNGAGAAVEAAQEDADADVNVGLDEDQDMNQDHDQEQDDDKADADHEEDEDAPGEEDDEEIQYE